MSVPHGESTFLLGDFSINAIPEEVAVLLEPHMCPRTFSAGEFLMRQGEREDSIMIVHDGVVEIFTTNEAGERQHINKASRGDVLGEMALLSGEPRTASVIALNDVTVLVLTAPQFHELAHETPELSVVLTKLVAERLAGDGPDVLHGKTFHEHRIIRRLGRGGMSIVYEAVDAQGRHVALKMMSHSLVYDDYAREQFEREARTIEELDHENIVRVFGRFAAFHSYFMIMEHCRGADLSHVIKSRAPLPADEVRKILGQLARAILAAHEAGLVHRDIKPSNIMLTADGSVKLMDFGLATPVYDKSLRETHKRVVGTPRYMAPEQLAGGAIDVAADYFAFGCVAHELMSGEPLFDEPTLPKLFQRHARWDLPSWTDLHFQECDWCRPLWESCLQREPSQRTPDLSEAAAWAESVDVGLVPDESADARRAWEDDTIVE